MTCVLFRLAKAVHDSGQHCMKFVLFNHFIASTVVSYSNHFNYISGLMVVWHGFTCNYCVQ